MAPLRIATEVPPVNVARHEDPEALPHGFSQARNQRRQRVPAALSPAAKTAERLKRRPRLRNRAATGQGDSAQITSHNPTANNHQSVTHGRLVARYKFSPANVGSGDVLGLRSAHGVEKSLPPLSETVSLVDLHDNDMLIWISRQILPHEPDVRQWLRAFRDIDTDDVIQECYAILLDVDITAVHTPRAYFFRIARNVVLQQYRRAKVISITALAAFDIHDIADDRPGPHGTIEARQELERLHDMIQTLPERCRQVLLLRKLEGLSQRQVSERLGISENVVEKQVARGLRALNRLFSADRPARPATRPALLKKGKTSFET